MAGRPYYRQRNGLVEPRRAQLDEDTFRKMVSEYVAHYEHEGYFQEAFGYSCIDHEFPKMGTEPFDLHTSLLMHFGWKDLPGLYRGVREVLTEDEIFDLIEFLYDHCSKPTERWEHDWNNCGWHCSKFTKKEGQEQFRDAFALPLEHYNNGYVLTEQGEIQNKPDSGLEQLIIHPAPNTADPQNVVARIEAAKQKFLRRKATPDDKRAAVADLAAALEFVHRDLVAVLTKKDEADLFRIVNQFGIRHNRSEQQTDYDPDIFLDWLFHHYLAATHAALRLIDRKKAPPAPATTAPVPDDDLPF